MTAQSNRMPPGIPYIIGNELAERFSYYGMRAILVVFMTQYLAMSNAEATVFYHQFSIAVYAFPFLGALLSDIFLGKYRTIILLSLVYCAGHVVLSLNETREGLALGLGLIALGSGGIKPCVSAHVGDQFQPHQAHLFERVYSYFYLSINVGAFISTLLTPWLLEALGPQVAFGIPGALMFIATFVFWMGRREFIAIKPFRQRFFKDLVSPQGIRAMVSLSVIFFGFIAFFWAIFDQTASTWVIQAQNGLMDKTIHLGFTTIELLPSQLQAANPLLILVLTPLFTFLLYPFVGKYFRVKPLRKIAVGLILASTSFFIVGWAEGRMEAGETVSIGWQFLAYLVLTAAEVMVSITALEFAYTQAPNTMKSFILSFYLLSVSAGNVITTVVNQQIIEPLAPTSVISGSPTRLQFESVEDFNRSQKIDITGDTGLTIVRPDGGTVPLGGTYLVDGIDPGAGTISLMSVQQQPLITRGLPSDSINVSTYKMTGANYFYFFAFMTLGVGLLFTVVARFYREEQYIQSLEDAESTPDDDAAPKPA